MQKIRKFIKSEGFRYLFFGGLATVFSIGSFWLLQQIMDYRAANLISLVATKIFAYVTNKIFVFRSKTNGMWALLKEAAAFMGARLVTFLIDYFGLILLVENISMPELPAKIMLQVIVVALNYVFSKLLVFRKKAE